MRSSSEARRVVALRDVVPFVILLAILSGCATSDSMPGGSRLPGEAASGNTRFFVNIRGRPHLEGVAAISDYAARGQFVVDELRRTAAASQAPVISFLKQRGVKYEPFWIANTILVEAGDETRKLIAGFPEVESIEPDQQIVLDDTRAIAPAAKPSTGGNAELYITGYNVARLHAPAVWKTVTEGAGIVVGVIDSGFAPHPAINARFRGFKDEGDQFDNAYNWRDTVSGDPCLDTPCDDNGHGTHVTGTIVGKDGNDVIGVAPAAQFIACRAFNRDGKGVVSAIVTCLQWFANPTDPNGRSPKPELRPQIVSMSLGASNSLTLSSAVEALVGEGTLVVAAAGNSGACKTIFYPGALSYALAVGAVSDDETTNKLAGYSSSGPIPNSTLIKPDLVAQGTNVVSAWPDGSYEPMNGTSMATPAVSGVAALVMSARPRWIDHPAQLAQLLRDTANRNVVAANRSACSVGYPNNASGWGLVNAYAAVLKAEQPPAHPE
jgi:subtilisin family serine protease